KFRQPMYQPLRDLSQELLLPGVDAVLPNSVLGLKTNRRFVEAYMVGLNVEMGRELLWRGFPTDQRGTCFDQFWDSRGSATPRAPTAPGARASAARVGPAPTRRSPRDGSARAVRDAAAQRPAAPLPDGHHLRRQGDRRQQRAQAEPEPRRRDVPDVRGLDGA